jgi:hypothetical protein
MENKQRRDKAGRSFLAGARSLLFYGLSLLLAALIEIVLARVARSNKNWLGDLAQLVGFFFFFAALAIIDSVGASIRRREQEAAQVRRDYAANQMYRALVAADPTISSEQRKQPYCLYLRPFTSTGDVKIILLAQLAKRASANIVSYDYPGFGRTSLKRLDVIWGDLETELAILLGRAAPLLALGRSAEHIGASRVQSTEETWKTDFLLLAEWATRIFLLPSTHEGTKWEIAQIIGNRKLIRKCIFIVPPEVSVFGAPATQGPDFKFGANTRVPIAATLRSDAIAALRHFRIDNSSVSRIQSNPWGSLVCLSPDRKVIAEEQLLFYRDAHLSFHSLFWLMRSLLWGKIKKLSRAHLAHSLRELEKHYEL